MSSRHTAGPLIHQNDKSSSLAMLRLPLVPSREEMSLGKKFFLYHSAKVKLRCALLVASRKFLEMGDFFEEKYIFRYCSMLYEEQESNMRYTNICFKKGLKTALDSF